MMRLAVGIVVAMALVACAADDDEASASGSANAPAPVSAPGTGSNVRTADTTSPACPEPPTVTPDAGTRPASPVDACSGYYEGRTTGDKLWLHLDENGVCLLGENIVLRANGTATIAGAHSSCEGTWKGDRTYFTLEYRQPGKNPIDGGDLVYDIRNIYSLLPSE